MTCSGPATRVEDAGDAHQPVEVGPAVAADLELEAALAVGRDDFVERLGQAVVDARAGRLVGRDDRVDQADGVARLDARAPARRPARKAVKSNAPRSGMIGCGHHAGQVAAHRRPEADAEQAADGVEDAAVDERVAEAGDERRQAELAAGAQLVAVVVGVEVERASTAAPRGRPRRRARSTSELVLVLRVAERRVLVEPLGGEHLGGVAEAFAAVVEADVDANERLHALGDGDDAEAERQAQAKRLLERLDAEHLELRGERRCGGHRRIVRRACGSVEPALQVVGDEGVVGEVGVLAADAVDRLALARAQPLVRVEAPRAFEQALAAQHLVAAGDAAVEVVARRRRRRCCSR